MTQQQWMAGAFGLLMLGGAQAGLPIGAEAAKARGVELPETYGISWQYLDQNQPLKVTRSAFTAGGNPFQASLDEVDNEDKTHTLRLDAWIFPFLNAYLIAGASDSVAEGTAVIPPGVFGPSEMEVPFRQEYEGDILGLGLTLAAAHGPWFATLDANYTETDIDISDDDAKATVISPRLGWNGQAGIWQGAIWLGAMYQDLQQTLQVESDFNGTPVTATIEEEAAEPWNALLGASWVFSPHCWLSLEGGFGKREQWMGSVGYRF